MPEVRAGVALLHLGQGDLPPGGLRLVLSGRVAELALPPRAEAACAAQALAFLRRIGLTVVVTGPQAPEGIAGCLARAGQEALRALLAMGVPSAAILGALERFGLTAPALPALDAADPVRAMDADQIVARWLGALANEGARLLGLGLAPRAGDIDLVAVQALGMPAASGGPLHLADRRGLLILRRDLQAWSKDGDVWAPVPALDAVVSAGRFGAD